MVNRGGHDSRAGLAIAEAAPDATAACWRTFRYSGTLPAPHHDPAAKAISVEARRLTVDDVDAVYALHLRVLEVMPRPGLVRPDSRAYFQSHVGDDQGFILGCFFGSRLIGYGLCSLPSDPAENYGTVLGLPPEELLLVGQLEGAAVDDAYWGRGIHRLLATWRANCLIAAGYRHVCATVAPGNVWSLRNLLDTGLTVRRIGTLYGGLLRYVMQNDVERPMQLDLAESRSLPLQDTEAQAALLDRGYVGHACSLERDGLRLMHFAPPLEAA